MKPLFILIVAFFIGAVDVHGQLSEQLKKPGPKNIDDYSFVYIHVIRQNETQKNWWYGLYINNAFVAKISDSCKYTIRFAVMPLTIKLSYARETDIQIPSPQANAHYYFKASVITYAEGKKDAVTSFVQMSEEEGKKEFETSGLHSYIHDYPQQLDVDLVLTKKDIHSYSKGFFRDDSVYRMNLRYRYPEWLQCFLRHPSADYFVYTNLPISKTYSEYVKLTAVEFKKIESETALKELVDKKFKGGKELTAKGDKLIIYEPVISTSPGNWTVANYCVIEDHTTPVKGSEPFLETRSLNIIFYTYSEISGKGTIWYVEYSVRGKQNELWSKEDMQLRMNDFMKGIVQWV
jgi:hypothetical protein